LGRDELGMDYAIGVASARGRGVGRAAIEGVLGTMHEAHAAGTAVSVTPQAANSASCRVLEKNGFTLVARVQPGRLPGRAPEGLTAVYRRQL
jgi:aminoglycoside 6'-N-acetyltransferase